MNRTSSLMRDLVAQNSSLRPQIYFKSSLIALARAMEDLVLAGDDEPLVIANFQQESFFHPQERRFNRIAQKTDQVYVLAVPNAKSDFGVVKCGYETISLQTTDALAGEKYLIIIGQQYSACLVGQEKLSATEFEEMGISMKQGKRFEGFWTFDLDVTRSAAQWLLGTIEEYRPHLAEKIAKAKEFYLSQPKVSTKPLLIPSQQVDLGIFTQRLVTYLQAAQYKLLKAYKTIAIAERKEHLINQITQAQRQSLNPEEILSITVRELGHNFPHCRCILYRIEPDKMEVTIENEFVPPSMASLSGQKWSVADNPVFIVAQTQDSALVINNVADNIYLQENSTLKEKIARAGIDSWLMVPIRYQNSLLGVLELHYSGTASSPWHSEDIALVEAVANNAGVALTQASAYTNLVDLNQKLAALERIQNNLIAVVGHELRTPITTIRVCLESLASEPNMPGELRKAMLETALADSERLGQLIQDMLTLSKLEAKKAYCNIESVEIAYALNLALVQLKRSSQLTKIPKIKVDLPQQLPAVLADAEGLVEVFSKLLENACKFTPGEGEIVITAQVQESMLEVIVADTGRGIEASQLETIFELFSQSEGYLRRTVNGAGLGLVICRLIINTMGGKIWATSEGEDKGSQFHFTIPVDSLR